LHIPSGNSIITNRKAEPAGIWRKMKMASITKDTIIGEILDLDETTAPFFLEMGMHCLGCPSARGETLEQACAVHGVDAEELVSKINAHLSK
jgi:hybrid cluster-associated redox disulfide protein